jgi:hypothetical protein
VDREYKELKAYLFSIRESKIGGRSVGHCETNTADWLHGRLLVGNQCVPDAGHLDADAFGLFDAPFADQ